MKVLVTGGAGFVGSHVVDRLVEDGCDVVVLDALLPEAHADYPEYLNPRATYRFADLTAAWAVADAVRGIDAVSHQAAMVGLETSSEDAVAYVKNNDLGTAVLLRALYESDFRGRILLASSMVVYGEGAFRCTTHGRVRPGPRPRLRLEQGLFEPECPICGTDVSPLAVTEEDATDPRSVYAATKLHQEHLCFAFGREMGCSVIALRYHNVYGPRMPRGTPYAGVAAIFRSRLQEGNPPLVFEDGCQTRDFVHVRDVARANAVALTTGTRGGAFNIATGDPHSVGEMAAALSAAFGADMPAKPTGRFRLGDVRHVFASPALAAEQLEFEAEVTFHEGMAAFVSDPLREPESSIARNTRPTFNTDPPGLAPWDPLGLDLG